MTPLELKKILNCKFITNVGTEFLVPFVEIKKYQQKSLIWKANQKSSFFAYIISGMIGGVHYTGGNDEVLVGVFGKGDTIGITSTLHSLPYPGDAKILSESAEVILVHSKNWMDHDIKIPSEVHFWIQELLLKHSQILNEKINILNAGTAEEKLFELFIHLQNRFGKFETNGSSKFPLALTRTQISQLIRIRPETVIRMMSAWSKNKLIKLENQTLILYPDFFQLRKILAQANK